MSDVGGGVALGASMSGVVNNRHKKTYLKAFPQVKYNEREILMEDSVCFSPELAVQNSD